MAKQKVIVYVDGFNFYYGLKSKGWRKFYWLDIVKFFDSFMRSHQDLVEVHYCSAVQRDTEKAARQELFFSANKTNPRFVLHLGKYMDKKMKCRACSNTVHYFEEKETDVQLATLIIKNVVQERCDISILVTADSDLMPPLRLIREVSPKHKVIVYFPPARFSYDLKNNANTIVDLGGHHKRFEASVLPNEITLASGYKLIQPVHWRGGGLPSS